MKILQVSKLYVPEVGGVETVVRDIAEELNPAVDMRVLVCQPKGAGAEEVLNGVKVTRAGSFGTLRSMPLSLDFFLKYRRMAKDADIILLHAPFPLGDIAALLFRGGAKLAVWWHSDIVRQKWGLALLRPIIHHTLGRAGLIVATAEEIIHSSGFLPRYRDKCAVIPYGLNFGEYPEQPGADGFLREKAFDKTCVKILLVGRLVYYKGAGTLAEAMKSVRGAELFIVGKGPLGQKLMAYARREGLSDRVHFLGELPREELLAAYRGCDMLVLPSVAKSETFGLCQLEAMYYGKPVVNTSLPTAVPTVSVDGETGITVPPGDAQALAAAIMKLAGDGALRELYGKNAARRVRERYNRADMAKALYGRYKKLLGSKP